MPRVANLALCVAGGACLSTSGALAAASASAALSPAPSATASASGTGVSAAGGLKVAARQTRPVTPYRGLVYTPEGIEQVREVARETERGQAMAEGIFAIVEPWLALSDQAISDLVPAADAVFAAGNAGDPKTGQSWPTTARQQGMCSLERPGTVRSPHTGDIYGNAAAGELYYDDGEGWVRPSDGRKFYFKGIWNSWIVNQMHEAVDNLALAYMLTGDEAVAERALLILDELATLRRKRALDPGLIDGYSYGQTDKGFFSYSGNGANSRMLQTAFALDLLGRSHAAGKPSLGTAGKSVFENAQENYFGVFEPIYKKTRHTLYNHTTILYANELAQGILFGKPELIREGLDVLTVWLEQTLNRDGQYYENAGGYERVGVNYAAMMMLPLSNYSPDNYENPEVYPKPEDYPFNLKFGNDPNWYSAAYLMKYRMMASGRMIAYGDMWEDRLILPGQTRDWDPRLWNVFGRLLYWQTDNPQWQEEIAQRYWSLPEAIRNEPTLSTVHEMGISQWLEPARPAGEVVQKESLLEEDSDLLPGKMIALLRSGSGKDHRTAFMSGSVQYSHGHDDQMALIPYAKGLNLTGNYGYPAAGSPAHRGWSIKPASHWTLVVNEDLPAPAYPAKLAPPASLQGWVPGAEETSVQLVEMSNPHLWTDRIAPDMSEYRRLHWLVDIDAENFYFLDFFRATGGRSHDYFWTGQWLDQADPGQGFRVEGVEPVSTDGVWSLAGLNPSLRTMDYNVPGRSWGERLDPGKNGKIRPLGIKGESINVDNSWNPPPGNGYGFVYDVRTDETTDNWSAQWDLIDRKNTMRLTFVNNEPQTAIIGRSPAMEVDRYHTTAIARRSGAEPLRSQFAALIEVAEGGKWPVLQAERIDFDPTAGMGVRLNLSNGSTDIVLAGQTPQSRLEADGVNLTGARGFVRTDAQGAVEEMLLNEGTRLAAGGLSLTLAEPYWQGRVIEVLPDALHNAVVFDRALPAGSVLQGQAVIFTGGKTQNAPQTLQDVTYVLEQVRPDARGSIADFGAQRMVSSTVVVEQIDADGAVNSTWPNEIRGGRFNDTGYYTGRRVAAQADPSRQSVVAAYPNRKKFIPQDKGLFKEGEKLEFYMVQAGDSARIPASVALKKDAQGGWVLLTNADVTVRLPARAGQVLFVDHGAGRQQVAAAVDGHVECLIPVQWMGQTGKVRLQLGQP